jgi:hypothetical protein
MRRFEAPVAVARTTRAEVLAFDLDRSCHLEILEVTPGGDSCDANGGADLARGECPIRLPEGTPDRE